MVGSGEVSGGSPSAQVQLLWGLRDQTVRGPRPALNLPGIARSAIDIADADGLDAVSMQRVAGTLEVTKMALYRYVSSKAELIAVMTETAVGEPPDLEAVPGGWRPKLTEWASLLRATWQRHPWLPGVTVGDRVMGPQEIGWTESAVRALDGTGLTGSERMDSVFLISGHIRNVQSAAGTQPWTTQRRLSPVVMDLMHQHGDRFPALIAASESGNGARDDNGWEFGLQRALDGIELFIDGRRAGARAPRAKRTTSKQARS